MSHGAKQRRHVIAGWATIGVVALVVLVVACAVVASRIEPEHRTYVLYVTDSGTLGTGDPVVLNGRKIGEVSAASVTNRNGAVQTRIEIAMLERYRDLPLPTDSIATVSAPGLFSGPRLVITYGSKPEVIDKGGELENTKPAPSEDQFSVIDGQLENAALQIDAIVELLDNKELMNMLQQDLASFRDSMDEVVAMLGEFEPGFAAPASLLQGRPEELQDLLANIRYGIGDVSELLDSLTAGLNDGSEQVDAIREQTDKAIAQLEKYADMSERAANTSRDTSVQRLFFKTRWLSAQLASMLRRGVSNPAAVADAPGRRRANEAFNGGDTALGPLGGDTDVETIR